MIGEKRPIVSSHKFTHVERSVSEPSVSAPDPGRQTKTSSAFFPASSRSVSPKDSRVFLPALPV